MAATVFITGASRGVGLACAQVFLAAGWNVYATARDPKDIEIAFSDRLAVGQLDARDDASISAAASDAIARFGAVDVLLSNAGIGLGGPIEAVSRAEFEDLLDVNVIGAALVAKALLPGMRERRRGMIINMGSLAGAVGLPLLAPYCASKFALAGLSDAMRYELKPHGIRVKLIELTGSRTQFKQPILSHDGYAEQVGIVRELMGKGLERAMSPEKVAEQVVRIASSPSDRFRYAFGNGGWFLRLQGLIPDTAIRAMLTRMFGLNKIPATR